MIGMILVTHGRLAEHFIDAMEHVVGKQDGVATICIGPNDDMEQRRADIADAIREVDEGQGAIILTDLFGGTPSNLAISLLDTDRRDQPADAHSPCRCAQEHERGRSGQCRANRGAQLHHRGQRVPRTGSRKRAESLLSEARRTIEVVNQRGLHARASAKFVNAVAELPDGCAVRVAKGDNEAAGGSILGLMMLGAAKGDSIDIIVTGDNAEAVLADLAAMVEDGFGEP